MNNTAENYLRDLCALLTEYAREAIQDRRKAINTGNEQFKTGYMMGLHRVVLLMQQQAQAFGISLESLGLQNITEEEFFKN